jgi:FMN reductase
VNESFPVRVVALTAGVRAPSATRRLSDALVAAVVEHLARRGEHALTRTVEVREHALDVTCTLLSGERSDPLADAVAAVGHADLLVATTPVYNGSYSGLFKSFVDLLDPAALLGTPVVLGATGGSMRHSLVVDQELRPLFAFFQAAPVATGVFATPEEWRAPGVPGAELAARIDRAAWEAASLAALGSSTTSA